MNDCYCIIISHFWKLSSYPFDCKHVKLFEVITDMRRRPAKTNKGDFLVLLFSGCCFWKLTLFHGAGIVLALIEENVQWWGDFLWDECWFSNLPPYWSARFDISI